MSSPEILNNIAGKLGINNFEVKKKAWEYLRNVNTNSTIALDEMIKRVICLDIAATQFGEKFDKSMAHKICVVSKPQYHNKLFIIKNLLHIEEKKSINEICIQLSCEEASKPAESLLNKYKELDSINRDFNHPQYAVAAVYTICKLRKISIKKTDFIDLSTLKSQQWTKLETEFMKFAEEHDFKTNLMKKTLKKKGNELLDIIEQKSLKLDEGNKTNQLDKNKTEIESYEDWKLRILNEAYAHQKT